MHVAKVSEEVGVPLKLVKQLDMVVPLVQRADVPHKHTLLTHRLDKRGPQAAAEPHLQVPASQVSVVRVHVGLQVAKKKKSK